ncbi:50S ribosomal protein L31e [Hyperthermus butylicus]|uniref:Large ribosomal subunit protein eL31 n=1 Tax=Hyperthermus butylicus (strain DSM 5456 / JCM 9403 / PLM1-5) TaxID=415426 RepID=RL31_HYPBU|nr:50S ribosomal protein L31e [Hyperthermus butylicus]A2BN56.1 RecName: Full=Large ribosomal subunit protein eL31; AltName: Full=50S ribosomal protein L31e [Hyperthermus butylicus DSM 5456]ABM81417.1 50S ribosomal protein L31e [Hyperthermus butylicus DSM 5456]
MPKDKKEAIYTIPLSRVYWGRRTNRAARAIKLVRKFIARHFGVKEEDVIIHNNVNEYIWSRSIEKPPRRVTVKAVKDPETGKVKVMLIRESKIQQGQATS